MRTERLVRWARKAEAWSEAPMVTNPEALAEAETLPVFEACSNPGRKWDEELPQYHIAIRPNGDRFLVNTEGYDYARYIARLPKACPSCHRTEERTLDGIRPIELNANLICAACQQADDEMK